MKNKTNNILLAKCRSSETWRSAFIWPGPFRYFLASQKVRRQGEDRSDENVFMMKHITFITILFFLLCFGCGEDSKNDNPPRPENIPEWLIAKISQIEKEPVPPIIRIQIYKGEWNGPAIYFINDIVSSASACSTIYYENGECVSDLPNGFCEDSDNWTLIYQYGKE